MTGPLQRRINSAVSILQASRDSPTLTRLVELGRESSARLQAIAPSLPPGLRDSVVAGPIEGPSWCLLLDNSAAAAKLRQMLPSLITILRSKGWEVETIRLKVRTRAPRGTGA